MHVVGDDGAAAPAAQEMGRESQPEWSIEPLTLEKVGILAKVTEEGFGTKVCCCCCPVADGTKERMQKYYTKHPERQPLCGLAVGKDGVGLGFVAMAIHPMNDKDGLHETKPGEAYVEQLAVATAARGKGIGKALLEWAEAKAREHGCTQLTLAVLNGNRAIHLYERFGFKTVDTDPIEMCCTAFVVCFLMGRPYGLCDPHVGSVDMVKVLAPVQTAGSS